MGNNWQNRERKVHSKRDNKYLSKPFKKVQTKPDTDSKKKLKVQIRQAQKLKQQEETISDLENLSE